MSATIQPLEPLKSPWNESLLVTRLRERPELILIPLFAIVFFGG